MKLLRRFLRKPRILIVDSDKNSVSRIKPGLESKRYSVSTAEGHEEAIGLLLKDSFDLIVVEMGLPRKGCGKLFRFVRNRAGGLAIPFIFIATREYAKWWQKEHWGRTINGGPDLVKPFSIQDLEELIIQRLKRAKEIKRYLRRRRKEIKSSTEDE